MKIGIIIKEYATRRGGAERYTVNLCNTLAARGHEVHVFTRLSEEEKRDNIIIHLIKTPRFPRLLRKLAFIRSCKRETRLDDIDVVFALTQVYNFDVIRIGGGLQRFWLRKLYPSPVMRILRLLIRPVQLLTYVIEDRIFRRKSVTVITNSRFAKNQLVESYAYPDESVKVIYNGVDHATFAPMSNITEKETVRKELNIPKDAFVMLHSSNSFKRKGLMTIIKALPRIKERIPHVRLVLIGKDTIKPFLKKAKKLSVADYIDFRGHVTNTRDYYNAADVFVFPSLYDPFANVCLESLACGRPVITSQFDGSAEIIKNGENGFILQNPLDANELAEIVLQFFSAKNKASFSQSAYQSSLPFTNERNAAEMESVLREAANRKHKVILKNNVVINADFAKMLSENNLHTFEDFYAIHCDETFRTNKFRDVFRATLKDSSGKEHSFYVKRHRQSFWEGIKPLLRLSPPRINAKREWDATVALTKIGIKTPLPVAYGEESSLGVEKRSFSITEELTSHERLETFIDRTFPVNRLRNTSEVKLAKDITSELARIARIFHGHGFNHHDFYLGHFFIDTSKVNPVSLCLLDLQRVEKHNEVSLHNLIKDLGQLLYTSQNFRPIYSTDRMRFYKRYKGIEKLSAKDKSFIGKLFRKAHSIRIHTDKQKRRS